MTSAEDFLQIKNGFTAVTWGFKRTELACPQKSHVSSISSGTAQYTLYIPQ